MKIRSIYLTVLILFFSASLFSQECYILEDHIGAKELNGQTLLDAACELKTQLNELNNVPNSTEGDFRVYGYNFYPVLAAVDSEYGMDQRFDEVEVELENKSNYVSIVKYLTFEDNKYDLSPKHNFEFKVYLDLDGNNAYDALSAIQKQALKERLNNVILENNTSGPSTVITTEIKVFEEIINYLQNPSNIQGVIKDLDFNEFLVQEQSIFDIKRTSNKEEVTPSDDGLDVVHNFGGYTFNGGTLEESLNNGDPGLAATISSAYYLCGKELTANAFSDFYEAFKNDPSEIKMFIYFDFETESSSSLTNNNSGTRNDEERKGYYILDENLSQEQSDEFQDEQFQNDLTDKTNINGNSDLKTGQATKCSIVDDWQHFGRNCIYNTVKSSPATYSLGDLSAVYINMHAAAVAGVIDGMLATIDFVIFSTTFLVDKLAPDSFFDVLLGPAGKLITALSSSIIKSIKAESDNGWKNAKLFAALINVIVNPAGVGMSADILYSLAAGFINFIQQNIVNEFHGSVEDFVAYQLGVLAFDAILTGLSGGSYLGAKVFAKGSQVMKGLKAAAKQGDSIADVFLTKAGATIKSSSGGRRKAATCANGLGHCFVKDTPVLMASNANQFSLRNSTKAMAVAAAMPIVAVPIQEVQLLDYAVAHETVNATYGMTASMDVADPDRSIGNDTYLGLMDKDPYTSDQQRERDKYEINDTDWNEVVFEEVYGSSTAKLALHNEWISQKGYQVEDIVDLNLPEQGISGPFRITSIKHIIPQKKPVDDDEYDDYAYKPVTALFTHESNQVYTIDFDNGESLGVTYKHPIYSVTAGDWRMAGELEVGEKVLAKVGETTVSSSVKKEGSETVYNLEVKELHNFLVGESGIIVHNSYLDDLWVLLEPLLSNIKSGLALPIKNTRSSHKLAAKALGVNSKKRDKFADAVRDADWTTIDGMGYDVKPTSSGNAMGISKKNGGNTRYRTPEVKSKGPNKDKLVANVETKPSDLSWEEWDYFVETNDLSSPVIGPDGKRRVSNVHLTLD